jgi:hypothetical protein
MITVASFPDDLGVWDQDVNPFYLEVFGEAEPLLDMTHAEIIPVGGSAPASASPTPIYGSYSASVSALLLVTGPGCWLAWRVSATRGGSC